jgi:GST-like protein
MIDVYSWATPNGHKVHIMLEECGLAYRVIPIDIGAGDQFGPAFLAISPNNKIPAIVDPQGPDGQPISLFESGAILLYLAGKSGKFLPQSTRGKYETLRCSGRRTMSASMPRRRSTTRSTATPTKPGGCTP